MAQHFLRTLLLAAIIFAAVQSSTFAGEKSLTIVNLSGRTIYRMYVSASHVAGVTYDGSFYGDVLGSEILLHGSSMKIICSDKVTYYKYWDIRVDFKDDDRWFWYNLNLLNVSKMIVDKEGKLHLE